MATEDKEKFVTYKVTTKNNLKLLMSFLCFLFIPLIISLICYSKYGVSYKLAVSFIIGFVIVSPIFLMGILVHKNYYCVNKKDNLVLYENEMIVSSSDSNCISRFAYEDIETIDIFMVYEYSRSKNRILKWLLSVYVPFFSTPWNSYNHAVLKMKNGKVLVVTSLLCPVEFWIRFLPSKIKIHQSIYRSGLGLKHKL